MSQLTGDHDDLSAMMGFMCDQIRKDMPDVEGKVSPDV